MRLVDAVLIGQDMMMLYARFRISLQICPPSNARKERKLQLTYVDAKYANSRLEPDNHRRMV